MSSGPQTSHFVTLQPQTFKYFRCCVLDEHKVTQSEVEGRDTHFKNKPVV